MVVEQDRYYRVWRIVLGDWLCWSAKRVDRYCKELYRPQDAFFFHDSPFDHVSHLLVPGPPCYTLRFWWDSNPGEWLMMRQRIRQVARINDAEVAAGTFDWTAARVRVEAVLGEVGARLPGRRS